MVLFKYANRKKKKKPSERRKKDKSTCITNTIECAVYIYIVHTDDFMCWRFFLCSSTPFVQPYLELSGSLRADRTSERTNELLASPIDRGRILVLENSSLLCRARCCYARKEIFFSVHHKFSRCYYQCFGCWFFFFSIQLSAFTQHTKISILFLPTSTAILGIEYMMYP